MKTVWMLVLCFFAVPAMATEFKHIRLDPQFEQYLTASKLKSSAQKSFAPQNRMMEMKMRSVLLGSTPALKSDWSSPIPVDGEESTLYEEIRNQLEASHQEIGLEQVSQINQWNQQFNLGSSNFSGFSWQKPVGAIQVHVDRQVTPNFFADNWLIADTFTFSVEATTIIERLNEAGLANMSSTEIGAFAGLTFRRVYTYYHYANSYQEGLVADFSKLFLPFLRFNKSGMERMHDEEILKREDQWTIRAGGLISTPPLYNLSFSAGVLAEHAFERTTTLQSTHTNEADAQRYRLKLESERATSIGATLELQLDFFKLIKFSLLRYDLDYEYASAKNLSLAFSPRQWDQVNHDQGKEEELRKLLRGKGEVRKLEPYVVRLDESSSSSLQQRGSVLIWGRLQKSKTEQIRVIKDQTVKVFFKSYYQSVKVVQNFFSRIFSAVVYKILQLPVGTTNSAMYNRKLTMEHEATHPQATDPKIARVENSEQFSFVLTQSFDAAKTHRWIDGRIKKDVIWFVDVYTTLPKDYKGIIRSEQLRGPLRIESNLRVEKAGFDHLLNSSEDDVFGDIASVCDSRKKKDWMNASKRKKLMKKLLSQREDCVRDIGKKFLSFRNDYLDQALKPSLAKFKDFVLAYYKKAQGLHHLVALFGAENSFINGRLEATTSQGAPFVLPFSAGQFRGLGVIDNFKRADGSRAPASILSE